MTVGESAARLPHRLAVDRRLAFGGAERTLGFVDLAIEGVSEFTQPFLLGAGYDDLLRAGTQLIMFGEEPFDELGLGLDAAGEQLHGVGVRAQRDAAAPGGLDPVELGSQLRMRVGVIAVAGPGLAELIGEQRSITFGLLARRPQPLSHRRRLAR